MTNEEFITFKRRSKFDIIWNNLIKKLPKSSQPSLKKNGCAFNSKLFNHNEQYIICRRTEKEKERGSTIYLNKCDVESVFVDYEGCVRDIREYQIGARERLYNGLEVFQSDINKLQKKISKEIMSLKNEKFYAETLIRLGGGSVKIESKISRLSLARLHEYIRECRAERKYKYIYFEFKEYGIDRIIQIILHKYKVQDVLVERTADRFVEFCGRTNIMDIYDLMLVPYYAKELVDEFGNGCIQAVITSIKTFIELQTFEYANIVFDDLE